MVVAWSSQCNADQWVPHRAVIDSHTPFSWNPSGHTSSISSSTVHVRAPTLSPRYTSEHTSTSTFSYSAPGEVDRRLGGGDPCYSKPEAHFASPGGAGGFRLPPRLVGAYSQPPPPMNPSMAEHPPVAAPRPTPVENEQLDLWQLLDDEFKPSMPINDSRSQQIFHDHKTLAHKLLVVQEEIVYLDQKKNQLLQKLSQQNREHKACNERYSTTIQELENQSDDLQHSHSRLSQQVDDIRKVRSSQQQPIPTPAPQMYYQSPPARPPVSNQIYPNFYDHKPNPHLGHQ